MKKTIISFGLNTKKCDCGNGNSRLLEKEKKGGHDGEDEIGIVYLSLLAHYIISHDMFSMREEKGKRENMI